MDLFSNFEQKQIYQLKQSSIILFKSYFSNLNLLELRNYFNSISFVQNKIFIFGKTIPIPRQEAWFGPYDYSYSQNTLKAAPFPAWLEKIKSTINEKCRHNFNSCLVNRYRDGSDYAAWHSDDEVALGPDPHIASVSFGASRRFSLKSKSDPNDKLTLNLDHGDLLYMGSGSQLFYRHSLPKTVKKVDSRYNLTFRVLKSS